MDSVHCGPWLISTYHLKNSTAEALSSSDDYNGRHQYVAERREKVERSVLINDAISIGGR